MNRRFIGTQLALTVVVLLLLEVPLAISFARGELDDLTARVERDAVVLASYALEPLSRGVESELPEIAEEYEDDTGGRVIVVDAAGRSVADSGDTPGRSFGSRPEVAAALGGRISSGTRRSETLDEDLLYVGVPVASSGRVWGAVRITFPTSGVDERVRRYWATLIAVALVCLLVASFLAVALARSVTRPLRTLETAAVRLGRGDLAARTPDEDGPREIRLLQRTFNNTAARLEELVGAQEAFVADVSHGLRTPLTALRLRLENLEADVRKGLRPEVAASLDEVLRLSRTVEQLLALARADRAEGAPALEPVDLDALLNERRDAWTPLVENRGLQLRVRVDTDRPALARHDHLAEILDNLFANAVDASPPGGTIDVAAEPGATDGQLRLTITDDGPGLSAQMRERAFDRFRTSGPVPGGLGGSGLGLAISRRLARAAGGDVVLEDAPGRGLCAVVVARAQPRVRPPVSARTSAAMPQP